MEERVAHVTVDHAYAEGQAAQVLGRSMEACPYTEGTLAAEGWKAGFEDAQNGINALVDDDKSD